MEKLKINAKTDIRETIHNTFILVHSFSRAISNFLVNFTKIPLKTQYTVHNYSKKESCTLQVLITT